MGENGGSTEQSSWREWETASVRFGGSKKSGRKRAAPFRKKPTHQMHPCNGTNVGTLVSMALLLHRENPYSLRLKICVFIPDQRPLLDMYCLKKLPEASRPWKGIQRLCEEHSEIDAVKKNEKGRGAPATMLEVFVTSGAIEGGSRHGKFAWPEAVWRTWPENAAATAFQGAALNSGCLGFLKVDTACDFHGGGAAFVSLFFVCGIKVERGSVAH